MVRVAGLTPVFADVDPRTFNLDSAAFERAITARTVAVVPTHLYGLPCQMDAIMSIAERHGLRVVEDCAHALGARFKGRQAGTFGDAAFFSFQTLKPLNTYGGGIAVARDPHVLERVRAQADAEPWPNEERVNNRLKLGSAQRIFSSPGVFTLTAFPALLAASLYRARPDVYLWEKIRPLSPMPESYRERYTNVQAALGLAGLDQLENWTRDTRAHARIMDAALSGLPGVQIPFVPDEAEHVYYQYLYLRSGPRLAGPPRAPPWRGRRNAARRRLCFTAAVRQPPRRPQCRSCSAGRPASRLCLPERPQRETRSEKGAQTPGTERSGPEDFRRHD